MLRRLSLIIRGIKKMMNKEIKCPEPGQWIGCNYPFEYKGYIVNKYRFDDQRISVINSKGTKMKLFDTVDEAMAWVDEI